MKSRPQVGTRVDRRTTIKWLAATMVTANSGCASNGRFVGEEIPPAPNLNDALLGVAGKSGSIGYGTDPDLLNPMVPWPRTMTAAQLETTSALCDLILPEDDQSPAASAVGVPDFIDEWISAPYEQQQYDREKVLAGLEWLEQQSRDRFGRSFVSANENQASELLDSISVRGQATTGTNDLVTFFERFRFLSVGAFYTTEAGIDDIGYIGNVAINGAYPGPSDAAMTHLAGVLDDLGLNLPG
jgi:hypothetical protein